MDVIENWHSGVSTIYEDFVLEWYVLVNKYINRNMAHFVIEKMHYCNFFT